MRLLISLVCEGVCMLMENVMYVLLKVMLLCGMFGGR